MSMSETMSHGTLAHLVDSYPLSRAQRCSIAGDRVFHGARERLRERQHNLVRGTSSSHAGQSRCETAPYSAVRGNVRKGVGLVDTMTRLKGRTIPRRKSAAGNEGCNPRFLGRGCRPRCGNARVEVYPW